MADQISHAKEVYFKTPKEYTGTNQIVPVRGVYVTGLYKPPLYTEPTLRLTEISGGPATVETYTTASATTRDYSTGLHFYDAFIDASNINIDWYSRKTIPDQTFVSSIHPFDIDIDPTCVIDYYTRQYIPDQAFESGIHPYDIDIDLTQDFDYYTSSTSGSMPEPIVRLTTIESSVEISNV